MKRIVWLTMIVATIGATALMAGPFKTRAVTRGQSPQAQPAEHRTYCAGWADARLDTPLTDARPVVWVLDGAGDLKGCSNSLAQVNTQMGEPVELVPFSWSHGHRRLYLDQTDTAHAREQGSRVAAAILERKAREPGRRIVVVGHSAGCAVALAAGDVLPIEAIDRLMLLSPSVSTTYDIRPALVSAKEGMDVYISKKDWVALGFVVRVVGTTDNNASGVAAGRYGFQPTGANALTASEAARLHQHFWSPDVAWTGNTGGHHGVHAPEYVKSFLMPLMMGR
jgi:predicted esterase